MVRSIIMITIALAVMNGVANAAKNVTPITPASHANRHACGSDYDFVCGSHRCSCVPR